MARSVRNIAKANEDKIFANAQSAQSYTRAVGEIAPTGTQLSGLLGLQNARRLSAANHTAVYEHNVALADKYLGIATSVSSKLREIDRANKVESETYNDTYHDAVLAARLDYEVAIADYKLIWRQAEAIDQQSFTTDSVPINYAFSTAIIGLDRTYQVQVAAAEETRQFAHATAEGVFFNRQTAVNNTKRSTNAREVIALWNVHESTRVNAHIAINNALQLPWTQYLVDSATARAAWWNSASVQYANLATERNAAETTYTGRLATAHVIRQRAIATQTKNKSLAEANSQFDEAMDKADAVRDYFTNMVAPTYTYVDTIAQAEHKQTIDIAQARLDHIDHEDGSQLNAAIQTANNVFNNTKSSQNSTYRSALASQQADQYLDFATAEYDRKVTLIAADAALVTTRNNEERKYRIEELNAYLQSATTWANIDATYRQYEANSFASAAASLASSHGSPWATYDEHFYAGQAANVTTVSNAARTNAIKQATAQHLAETRQTNAETNWRNLYATTSNILNTAIAGAHKGFATKQSMAYAAADNNNLELPSLSSPTDLAGQYMVAGPHSDYRMSLYSATSTSYAYPYAGYWWGAWGYYGSDNWFTDYGGYYDYLYGSQVSSAAYVYLYNPAKQFPGSFWQMNSGAVADQMLDSELQFRYGDTSSEELTITDSVPPGVFTPLSPVNPDVSDGAAFSNDEVIAILSGLDPEASEYWTLHGSTTQTVVSERPSVDLATFSPELADAQPIEESSTSDGQSPSDAPARDTTSATGSLTESAGAEEGSFAVAERISSKAADASGVTTFAQHLGRANGTNLTPMQKLNAYLQGVNNQKGPGIFDHASQISVNLVMGYINGQNGSLTNYGKGFAKGFFIDGAWGNVEGISSILKFGWGAVKQSWFTQARFLTFGNEWIFENSYFNFADQRKVETNLINAGQMIFKVLNVVGTELGDQAVAHYDTLLNGSAADLQELGGTHQQVAAAVMSMGVLLSKQLREMTPETRGRISGAITWELAQTAAEIMFTAGVATVATKGAKFARFADKLADFAKKYDKLGALAQPVLNRLREITEPGGELRKLLEKFDEKAVVVAKAVRVVEDTLQNACFTPDTPVLTKEGKKPIGEIRPGQQVMAFDFENGQWNFREVKANTHNHYSGELVSVTIDHDTINATAEHPFWVVSGKRLSDRPTPRPLATGEEEGRLLSGRWVNASDLEKGDVLHSSSGQQVTITSVSTRRVTDLEVCNLSVGENHFYAVGRDSVLVHNATWCSVLTDLHPGWDKIRANLAKKFGVDISQIHGHHIVQKQIEKEFYLPPKLVPNGKLVGDLTDTEFEDLITRGLLSDREQSAWYIGKSQELLRKADVEIYSPQESGKTTVELLNLLKEHLKEPKPGKSGANLTLALNDTDNVHTPETQRAVYKLLKAVEGNQANTERVLREIGDIFRQGRVPRANAQGWDYTSINGQPVK